MSVRDILQPGTTEQVAKAYEELSARARVEDFGLLEQDVVVLDTETTGLSFSSCKLIEIAAARLRGREVTARFRTYVHPGVPIPEAIQRLTGIVDADVAQAPQAPDAVAQLAEFVAGAPVLAHNATFDRTFVERVPGGREVSDLWVDTLALSRIALPRLSTHRLADMAEAFGCASVSHRAMDDVDALAGMWRVILCALTDLPTGLLSQLAHMHPEVEWAYRPILSHLALGEADAPFSLARARRDLMGPTSASSRTDAREREGSLVPPTAAQVEGAFGPGGVVESMYGGFEARPEQVKMAEEVRRTLAGGKLCALEAGTGVGKSVAYLLPLALYAKRNDVTCGIATKTNALTDQLVSHELPALSRALPGGVSYYSLKGYEHYPCLRRLERSSRADLPVDELAGSGRSAQTVASDMLTAIAVTYAYACQSADGDLDALGIRWGSVPRSMLTISASECDHSRCPFYPNLCFLHGARRRAEAADIVVTNHSLLLRNVSAEGRILPPVRNWVVDEAHSFEAEARRQWALDVGAERLRGLLAQLGGTSSGLIGQAMSRASSREGATPALGMLARAATVAAELDVRAASFFEAVRALAALAPASGGYDDVQVWLGGDARKSDEWAAVAQLGGPVSRSLHALRSSLEAADRLLEEPSSAPEPPQTQTGDFTDATRDLADFESALEVILAGEDDTYVYSANVSRSRRRMGTEQLLAEKLDVGSELAERWYPEMDSVTFASATMTVGGDFSHFERAVGLDRVDGGRVRELALPSGYDFDSHMAVVVARDMPDPYDRAYLGALEDLLYDVHVAMGGSVLTLFTNRREMERVHSSLAPRLAERGLEVALQGRASSARRLRRRFIEERGLSLMALRSFWEGFDAAGDTLRCVVIPKLPFSSPRDPLVQERGARDRAAWRRWSLPEAVLSVRQAAGRLIRTSIDEGVLVLADARLTTKGYGKLIIRSLPSGNVSELGRDAVGRFIETWRSSRGR